MEFINHNVQHFSMNTTCSTHSYYTHSHTNTELQHCTLDCKCCQVLKRAPLKTRIHVSNVKYIAVYRGLAMVNKYYTSCFQSDRTVILISKHKQVSFISVYTDTHEIIVQTEKKYHKHINLSLCVMCVYANKMVRTFACTHARTHHNFSSTSTFNSRLVVMT